MSVLGIYFGPKVIRLVETEGKRILHDISIPLQRIAINENDAKVPDEVRLAMVIKEELRKNQIQVKEADIVLLGRDLIVRTFSMPVLPPNEIHNAVRFEAKKYIPFKVEDLASDYQVQFDKSIRKNVVLFVGIKKDSLDKYLAIFSQLAIKVNSIEYAGYSILRLLKLSGVHENGIVAVVNVDMTEEDEINFVVMENGFPLFSRDIILSSEPVASASAEQQLSPASHGVNIEKIKIELRISFDFYLRKFPTKNIRNVVFICGEEYRRDLEAFIKERGLNVQFVAVKKFLDTAVKYSLSFLKAYACSLVKVVKTKIKIDLLPEKTKLREKSGEGFGFFGITSLEDLKINSHVVLLGIIILALPYLVDYYSKKPVKEQLSAAINSRLQIPSISASMSYEELRNINKQHNDKLKIVKNLLLRRIGITGPIDALPRIIPQSVWLSDISFKGGDQLVLNIRGSSYLDDSDQEFLVINKFLADLKMKPVFSKYFKVMSILSMDQAVGEKGAPVTNFVIDCRSQ